MATVTETLPDIPVGTPAAMARCETFEQLRVFITRIADTDFVPGHYRKRPHAMLAAIQTGGEIGLAPMEALNDIYIPLAKDGTAKGQPTLRAAGMTKLARRAGHSISGTVDAERAEVRGKRLDTGDEMTVVYTLEQARAAGLVREGSQWEKSPEDMLWARAVSRLCRRLFSDCLGSIQHTPEDLEETPAGRVQAALDRSGSEPGLDGIIVEEEVSE